MSRQAKSSLETREKIRAAAERCFANTGFAGTSINDIAAATGFTKPVIYYHFESKSGLFEELMEYANEEFYRRMQAAALSSSRLEDQLVEIFASLFEFVRDRKDLTRLAFAAAFSAPKDRPAGMADPCRRERNLDFFHGLVQRGLAEGTLNPSFNSKTLAYGIYGALSFHLMANVLLPGTKLDRRTAREIVRLFLRGAKA